MRNFLLFILIFSLGFLIPARANSVNPLQITTQAAKKSYPQLYLQISGQIPQIRGKNLNPAAINFNARIRNLDQFKNAYFSGYTLSRNAEQQGEQAAVADKSATNIQITYKITHLSKDLISIRFTMVTYTQGAAHPNTNYYSVNYNFKKQSVMELKTLFKDPANYLKPLARYSIAQLNKKYGQDMQAGAQPILENYNAWNISPQGLLISFNQYPEVLGEVSVLIPYRDLKQYLLSAYWPPN